MWTIVVILLSRPLNKTLAHSHLSNNDMPVISGEWNDRKLEIIVIKVQLFFLNRQGTGLLATRICDINIISI